MRVCAHACVRTCVCALCASAISLPSPWCTSPCPLPFHTHKVAMHRGHMTHISLRVPHRGVKAHAYLNTACTQRGHRTHTYPSDAPPSAHSPSSLHTVATQRGHETHISLHRCEIEWTQNTHTSMWGVLFTVCVNFSFNTSTRPFLCVYVEWTLFQSWTLFRSLLRM